MIANVLYATVALLSVISFVGGYTPAAESVHHAIICICLIQIAFGRRLK